ncbi:hypothetical protein JCM24511_03284 [Saitozyma sp. JCM 24511]|nr:hypothetical protein JCM24511_03284 [Saitozyma sp. JCM 24511]
MCHYVAVVPIGDTDTDRAIINQCHCVGSAVPMGAMPGALPWNGRDRRIRLRTGLSSRSDNGDEVEWTAACPSRAARAARAAEPVDRAAWAVLRGPWMWMWYGRIPNVWTPTM